MTVVTGQITVADGQSAATSGGVRSIVASPSAKAPTPGAPIHHAASSGSVRSILPPVHQNPQILVAAAAVPPAPSALLDSRVPPSLAGAGYPPSSSRKGVRPHPDLVVSSEGIRYEPSLPAAGQRVSFSASVRNAGNGVARRVALVFKLVADGKPAAGSPPLQFDLGPGATNQQTWQAAMPPGRQVQLWVLVSVNEGGNLIQREASVEVRAAASRRRPLGPPQKVSQHH